MVDAYGKTYDVDIVDFVEILGRLFNFQGMDRRGDEYYCKCPFHGNGQERTASASFKLAGDVEMLGKFYCFGCKTKGYLSSILTRLFGTKRKAIHWLMENFKQIDKEDKRVVNKITPEAPSLFQEFELPNSLFTNKTDYYNKRGIPDELVEKFKLGYSQARDAIILPVWEDDKITFYQVRYLSNQHGLKWYIPKDAKVRIFGKQHITGRTVIVVESVFNCLTLWKYGYQSVALFGARDDDSKYELLELPCLKYIIAFDGDEAGEKTAKTMQKFLRENNKLVTVAHVDKGKDINDFAHLSKEDFDKKWQSWLR